MAKVPNPYGLEQMLTHWERRDDAQECQAHNWVSSRGFTCSRKTHYVCLACSERVCATHTHQHAFTWPAPLAQDAYSSYTPQGRRIGRTMCERHGKLELDTFWRAIGGDLCVTIAEIRDAEHAAWQDIDAEVTFMVFPHPAQRLTCSAKEFHSAYRRIGEDEAKALYEASLTEYRSRGLVAPNVDNTFVK